MLGYDHDRFWEQTPRILSLTFEAHRRRMIQEHNGRAWLAWHVAAFSRQKKLDARGLKRLMISERRTTVNDQIQGLTRWVIATGGTVNYKEKVDG